MIIASQQSAKTHVIHSTGVNSAYLEPGEDCFSLDHLVCGLIVLSNGTQTFVTHQFMPFKETLIPQLQEIKRAMGGNVKVTVCYDPKRLSEEYKQDYLNIAEYVAGPGKPYEKQENSEGAYHIASNSKIEFLKQDSPEYIQAVGECGITARKIHHQQPIIATNCESDGISPILRYSMVPTFISNSERPLITTRILPDSPPAKWNDSITQSPEGLAANPDPRVNGKITSESLVKSTVGRPFGS